MTNDNLEAVRGIGQETAAKLMAKGITTIAQLSNMRPEELKAELGITLAKAKAIVQDARSIVLKTEVECKLADELDKEMKERIKIISTGAKGLDGILGGGIRTDCLTGIAGEYCHSEDTMVFTEEGFKSFEEVKVGDKVLGIDKNHNIVQTEVIGKYEFPYSGKLIHFHSRRYDFLVTPMHRMIFKAQGENEYKYINAYKLLHQVGYFLTSFNYEGNLIEYFDIHPYIKINREPEHPKKAHPKPNLKPLPANLFMEFMGWYISEGCIFHTKRGDYISIRQTRHSNELESLLKNLELDFKVYEGSKYVIFHRDLAEYCKRCGQGAKNKTIPKELLRLSREQLYHLFKGLMLGDGSSRGYSYFTSSKQLAHDFLLLLLKLGFNGSIVEREIKEGGLVKGKRIRATDKGYCINISYEPRGYFSPWEDEVEEVDYQGKVWCFETTTGNFFAYRNGKVGISGNSVGKTQLCFQLLVNNVMQHNRKGVYIETEPGTWYGDRVREIATAAGYKDDILKHMYVIPAKSIPDAYAQYNAYLRVEQLCEEGADIGLTIIDSFNAKFRSTFTGREQLPARSSEYGRHIGLLQKLASKYNMAVVMTVQVMGVPDTSAQHIAIAKTGMYKAPVVPDFVLHSLTWLGITPVGKNSWKITLFDSSFLPRNEAIFTVDKGGIKDYVGKLKE